MKDTAPIDLVYTWVDGLDPSWRSRYEKISHRTPSINRFYDYKTLEFSIRSARTFLPWLRNIFIITSKQEPQFNYKAYGARIIEQNEILGPQVKLETFNSQVVEAHLHCIPELSERFLYANDDMIFGNYLTVNDFFRGAHPICMMEGYRPHQAIEANVSSLGEFDNLSASQKINVVNDLRLFGHGDYGHHLENTRLLLYLTYGIESLQVPSHFVSALSKEGCNAVWSELIDPLSQSMKHQLRSYRNFHFIYLHAMVSSRVGLSFLDPCRHLTRKMYDGASTPPAESLQWFQDVWQERPHLLCLNSFRNTPEEMGNYHKLREDYINYIIEGDFKER